MDFPFLVLLISGGHCLLAVVENVATFRLLGRSIDTAPGEAFDKVMIFSDKHQVFLIVDEILSSFPSQVV